MPSKQQVKASIDTIVSNGSNTARKVRDVLNDILEFAAANVVAPPPAESNIKLFSHTGNAADKTKLTALKFSFRGIENHSVNFTFQIKFNDAVEKKRLEYVLPTEVMTALNGVIVQSPVLINFTVPVRKLNPEIPFHTSPMGVGISKDKKMLVLDFTNPGDRLQPAKGDTLYSSIELHSPFKD